MFVRLAPASCPHLLRASRSGSQTSRGWPGQARAMTTPGRYPQRGLEIGELGAFLHEVADRAFERLSRPSAGARKVCSIFIASSTSSGAPRGKSAPGSARMRVTVPGIGATIRLAAAASPNSAANGSIQCRPRRPRGVVGRGRGRTRRRETRLLRIAESDVERVAVCARRTQRRAASPPNSIVIPSRPYRSTASCRSCA